MTEPPTILRIQIINSICITSLWYCPLRKSEDSDLRIFNNEPDVASSSYLETGFEPQQSENCPKVCVDMYIVGIDIAKRFHEAAIIDKTVKLFM